MNQLLLAFYGDDFTGSADAMEALTLNGVKTALFLGQPSPERLQAGLAAYQAVGISGISRSMTPLQMDEELPPQFALLKSLNPRLIHYKVCATFDSSPDIGSIGHAADIGFRVIEPDYGIIVQGVPILGRYIVFGNHFTVFGQQVFRLDRHPMMSKHPITPMNESDLRLHFARQSDKKIALIDLLQLKGDGAALGRRLDQAVEQGSEIILFDTLDDTDLRTIGRLIHEKSATARIFALGSSGFEYAMASYWQSEGLVEKPPAFPPVGPVQQVIVMSGSAAAMTAEQINYAIEQGFKGVPLNTELLVDEQTAAEERGRVIRLALDYLKESASVVLYSTRGPDDPMIQKTKDRIARLGYDRSETGKRIGQQQGLILRELLALTRMPRICVAGGDTCSHTLRQLGIHSLELLMPIKPAAPLCRAFSDDPVFDGLQVASKGGQIGEADYFIRVLEGR